MALFHRNAYWLTLLAALLSLMFLHELRSGSLDFGQTSFQLGNILIAGKRITDAVVLALLGFLLQSLLYYAMRYRIRSAFLVPAHTSLSVLLLLGLLIADPVLHPVLMFNLLAFLAITQLLFVFALILALREMIRRRNR